MSHSGLIDRRADVSERDELVARLRDIVQACRHDPFSIGLHTALHSLAQRAADAIERDGARIAELERGEILTNKELVSAIVTAVMSKVQSDRDDALRKVQRHIIRVEQERDEREAECEHTSEHRALAERRIVELEAEVERLRAGGCARDQRTTQYCAEAQAALARAEAAAREAVAAWMIEHAFATGHGDTLTDLLAELSWQIAEIKRDAIKWRDTPIPVPPGECPYPIHADRSIEACVAAGDCGCGQNKT